MFNEANSVEAFVRDILGGTDKQRGLGWELISHRDLPRVVSDVLVDEHLREALIRLIPKSPPNLPEPTKFSIAFAPFCCRLNPTAW